VLQARLRQAQGDSTGALDLLDRAERLAERSTLGIDTGTLFTAYRIRIRLDGGDPESAARLAQERGLSLEGATNWQREPEYAALVRVLMAQGEHDVASTLLEQLIRQEESRGLLGRVIDLLVLQALVFRAKDAGPKALAALERSLSLAQAEGYIRVFLDEGEPMAELLRHVGPHGIAPEYVAKLLSEFVALRVPGAPFPTNQPIVEPLSERELEILRLVAEGKSNQQVAEKLVIATGTVKKHLNNIFGKLGVQSRTQCVARARELNVL
jgi:LuxR family maltose regulon positive regulatory protein